MLYICLLFSFPRLPSLPFAFWGEKGGAEEEDEGGPSSSPNPWLSTIRASRVHLPHSWTWIALEVWKTTAKPVAARCKELAAASIKRAIVCPIHTSALKRSCLHHAGGAIQRQFYPTVYGWLGLSILLQFLVVRIVIGVRNVFSDDTSWCTKNKINGCGDKQVVLPYFHAFCSNLKAVAKVFRVRVLLCNDYRICGLTPCSERESALRGETPESVASFLAMVMISH